MVLKLHSKQLKILTFQIDLLPWFSCASSRHNAVDNGSIFNRNIYSVSIFLIYGEHAFCPDVGQNNSLLHKLMLVIRLIK